MKNEKKVEARIATANSLRFLDVYVLPLCKKPDIISAYGYDYIREDKCMKWEKMGEINGVDIEYCKCPPDEEKELKAGDTVVLASESPIMTVVGFDKETGWPELIWFCEEENEFRCEAFPAEALKQVVKEFIDDDECCGCVYNGKPCDITDVVEDFNERLENALSEANDSRNTIQDIYNKYEVK